MGSRAELEKLTNAKVDDLHMEFIDPLTIPSSKGKAPLKRVEAVLDCWFESGSMPYAELHYPFENKASFEKRYPADFVAEGLDQTRGWFYTLMVLSSALFEKPAFKNVVVNGMILAEDGKKMSKSLRNYPDPNLMLNEHGADALRLYLIDSPAVRAQELRFSEKGVKDIVRRILLRWWNSYSFFVSYGNIDEFKPKLDYAKTENILDQWILSRLHSLIDHTNREMEAYRLYNVVPNLLQFVEDLTNTYIRFNRRHYWQDGMPEDKRLAYETLYEVLLTLSKVMAPFAPFLADTIYQNLAQAGGNAVESVHLEKFPTSNQKFIKPELEEAVKAMDVLVMLGRNYREKISVKAKIPLTKMKIYHRNPKVLETLKKFEPYFQDELNIQNISYDANEDAVVAVSCKANFPALGKRLGPKMKSVANGIQALTAKEIQELEKGKEITLEGEKISIADVEIRRAPKGGNENLTVHQVVSIEVDPTVTPTQIQEGLAREIARKIQAARKNAKFNLDDRIRLEIHCIGDYRVAFDKHKDMIMRETLSLECEWKDSPSGAHVEKVDLDGDFITLGVKVLNRPKA